MNRFDKVKLIPEGHVRIWEKETGKVLLDKHNAIHPENMSYAIASSISGNSDGNIAQIVFGSGGARATSSNKLIYATPQTIGRAATLYNQTYAKDVTLEDITVTHVASNEYTDITVHCTLGKNEPEDNIYNVNNNTTIVDSYNFSEIGLKTKDGSLITHITHYPISKANNITLEIEYLVRFQIV
jgi:hypothetical protein